MRVLTPTRSISVAVALLGLGCPHPQIDPEPEPTVIPQARIDDGDPRLDPSRCVGTELDLRAIVDAGVCKIGLAGAKPLPGQESLAIEAPNKLRVEPGGRLDFELELRNVSDEALTIDLALTRFLPLEPERTERVDKGSEPDRSCTLQTISTEPPPERISLPPKGVLESPCQWFANTRLVDPESYVGSECPDFPALAVGKYKSVFVVAGGGGTRREVIVEIVVK
jgi:hypothetical protein